MARTLVLLRHAKALDGAPDQQRPLAPQGLADARRAGRWLAQAGIFPARVVLSPARRAVQTWEEAVREIGSVETITVDARLYANTPERVLDVVRDLPHGVHVVAVVGHNPSLGELAASLDDGTGAAAARASVADGFPTAAVAVLDVAVEWASVEVGGARLRAAWTPASER